MGDFYGLSTGELANRHLKLEYLRGAGPRIVRLALAGTNENLLVELPEVTIPTSRGDYYLRGGHRLWHSPEATPRSYIADDTGVEVEVSGDTVRLVGPTEGPTGIRKTVTIQLDPNRPAVTVDHRLTNEGLWPVELAAWGITQLPLGGVAILPQQVEPLDGVGLGPNRQLVLWPYARWADPRLQLADDYILLRADPLQPPCKVGYLNRHGWVAYLRGGVLFVKRFQPSPDQPHTDFGCNAEFYCNDEFIEMESLGPLTRLEPGQSVDYRETWELLTVGKVNGTLESVRDLVAREKILPNSPERL